MKITSAEFTLSAVMESQYPKDNLPEIALIGRSNVGKSSLINKLINRKKLAKTSSTPGKTRTINFYKINNSFYFVDLPGYGYAKVPLKERKEWQRFIEEYFETRETLKGAFIVLDIRRSPTENETMVYEWLSRLGLPAVTVLTKADKFSKTKAAKQAKEIEGSLGRGEVTIFSATSGEGKNELLKVVSSLTGLTKE
jgi:GTP-binding protein